MWIWGGEVWLQSIKTAERGRSPESGESLISKRFMEVMKGMIGAMAKGCSSSQVGVSDLGCRCSIWHRCAGGSYRSIRSAWPSCLNRLEAVLFLIGTGART